MGNKDLRRVREIAEYQFGKGAGMVLFPESVEFVYSSTGRVRQIYDDGVRIATLKPEEGIFSLSIEGARRLHSHFPYPGLRVVVLDSVSEFIEKGGNVFAKHVVEVDRSIRANDEVIVVSEGDRLLATGKAILGAREMLEFNRGMAVSTRYGLGEK